MRHLQEGTIEQNVVKVHQDFSPCERLVEEEQRLRTVAVMQTEIVTGRRVGLNLDLDLCQ